MSLFFAITVLLIFFLLVFSLFLLQFHARHIQHQVNNLTEALWKRRNSIPLLLEVASSENAPQSSSREKIIEIRSKVLSDAYTLEEKMAFEKELTELLDKILKTPKGEEGSLQKNVLFLALKQEFNAILQNIRIALNDYNFAIQKFARFCRIPPLNILALLFAVRRKKVLPLL